MKNKKIRFTVHAAAIAALYVALTLLSALFGLSSGAIQLRVSEALTVLPAFTPAAIPGLFFGCVIANLLTSATPIDILVGSLATLVGAFGTYLLRKAPPFTYALPAVIANTVAIPPVLAYFVLETPESMPFFFLTVGAGELLSAGVLGAILAYSLGKRAPHLFGE
jgi:uncharacterized membrane protein